MQWRLFEKELGSREAQNWPGTNEWPSPWSDGAMNDESVVPKILLPSFVGCAPEAILRVLNLAPKLNNDHAEPFYESFVWVRLEEELQADSDTSSRLDSLQHGGWRRLVPR